MDANYIKRGVSVPHVLSKFGHEPVKDEGTALIYPVPWRPDSEPSLAVFKQNGGPVADRWADRARQDSGDVFDLYRRIMGCDFTTAISDLSDLVGVPFEEPEVQPQKQFNLEALVERYANKAVDHGMLQAWLVSKDMEQIPAEWLFDTFGVYMEHTNGVINIPYRNEEGHLVYGRTRLPGEPVHSPPGKYPGNLYGEHLDTQLSRPVVLCEGESDVWSGTYATQDYVFLGVPGASTRPENTNAARLAYRPVILSFDGDEAGRAAAQQWAEYLIKIECDVRYVLLPEGKDLREVEDIPAMLRAARYYHYVRPGLGRLTGGYYKLNKDNEPGQRLTNWTADPTTVFLTDQGAESYEVYVRGRSELLQWQDLKSKRSLTDWATERGLTWKGSDADAQQLTELLQLESNFVPIEHGYGSAGLHDGHFVWPGGKLGERAVRYIPEREGVSQPDFRMSNKIDTSHFGEVTDALMDLNRSEVTHPILAWLFAAFLRSTSTQFPILNIAGMAGTGKTATVGTVVPLVSGFDRSFGLGTNPSKYAMTSVIADTNAFPVVIDEYRTSGTLRQDDMLGLVDDIARACYNAQVRETGGASSSPMKKIKYPMTAPLIVAGETLFESESMRDRSVMVTLGDTGRNQDALKYLQSFGEATIAPTIMRFYLSERARVEGFDHLTELMYDHPSVSRERMLYNVGFLQQGWAALAALREIAGFYTPDPDFSAVLEEYEDASATDPLIEAIRAVLSLDRPTHGESVWVEDDEVYVLVEPFTSEAKRLGMELPGKSTTIGRNLIDRHGGRKDRVSRFGERKYVTIIPADRVLN